MPSQKFAGIKAAKQLISFINFKTSFSYVLILYRFLLKTCLSLFPEPFERIGCKEKGFAFDFLLITECILDD
jgi:hypothetical protein